MPTQKPPFLSEPIENFPPKKISAAVDFSEASTAALAAAKKIGRLCGARLDLVNINEPSPESLLGDMYVAPGQDKDRQYYDGLRARLRALAEDYPQAGLRVEDGYAKSALADLAESGDADLLVMGTRGRGGLERFFLGSTAEAVARVSRTPVLTVHRALADDWPARVLAPMKLSSYADKSLLYALALAELLGARPTILYVAENVAKEAASFKPVEEHLSRLLGRERCAGLGRIIAAGQVADAILRAVERERYDLIVLSARRKPFWESFVLGTTAERVIRHSPVPVLSIPSLEPARRPLKEPASEPSKAAWAD
ncbi:MAG TPA: universal stress protein [Elusimicrobiota bacterium]|nr:universal stress protein [Elusimicrobiota bacterium]